MKKDKAKKPTDITKRTETSSERHPVSPTLYQLRKYFVYVLVGGLIISALIAVIAVLVGNMTDLISKSISTVAIIIIHSLVALAFVSTTTANRPSKSSAVVVNTLFAITVLSLITAMLGVWEIISDGEIIGRQYRVYFTAFIISLIIGGLLQSTEKDKPTVIARNTAIGSSLVLFVMMLPRLYDVSNLADFYYRLLVATGIVMGVSIVITIIFHWYYMSRNPVVREETEPVEATRSGFMPDRPVLRVFVILFGIFFGLPVLMGIIIGLIQTISPS